MLFEEYNLAAPHADAYSATGVTVSKIQAEDAGWALGALVYEVDKLKGPCKGLACYSWWDLAPIAGIQLAVFTAFSTVVWCLCRKEEKIGSSEPL